MELRLPVDVEFGLQRRSQKGSLGESSYVSQLKRRLKFAHSKAKQMAKKQQAKHRELYDQKCRGAELEVGDLVLVKQTAWKGRHKIQDRWESKEYQVVGQPTPGVPVYTVKSVAGDWTRVLHSNLLLPLQGRIRQEGRMRGEGISGSEDEEEGGDEMPKVARAPCRRPRGTTRLKTSPSQQREASVKDASAELSGQKTHSLLASPSSTEYMSGDEDSSEDEVYTNSFTSNTTDTDSTTADLLTSCASAVEDNSHVQPLNISPTESQFTPDMPYLESSTQPDQTTDSVFTQQPSNSHSSILSSPVPLAPRRSTRRTKGAPLCILEKFIHRVQLFLRWPNQQSINKLCMFPAINQYSD